MSKEAMKLALEALENSIDLVSNEAREAEELYGKYPTRLARIQGLVALEVAHEKAITALREALAEQPAQQEPVAHFGSAYVNENGVHVTTVLGPVAIPQDAKLYTSPPAQQQQPEYAWPTVADYERDVGFQTNEAFRIAWNMARTTNRMLGHTSSQPAQQEPIDQLIHAWQAIEETSGHVLDEGDVECRMHMSVIRSAWEQMDSLVREIWDERGRP